MAIGSIFLTRNKLYAGALLRGTGTTLGARSGLGITVGLPPKECPCTCCAEEEAPVVIREGGGGGGVDAPPPIG